MTLSAHDEIPGPAGEEPSSYWAKRGPRRRRQTEPTVAVSVSMTIRPRDYESANVQLSISGLEAGATVDEIEELLDTGRLAFSRMLPRLREKLQAELDLRRTL